MLQNQIKIGTITANYNNGKYFKECLAGLLGQTIKPNYITVIDDVSKDDSWDLIINECCRLAQKPKDSIDRTQNEHTFDIHGIQTKLFKRSVNGGPAGARNVGLRYLLDKVDCICIADSDDILYYKKIEKSLNVMVKYPHVGLVYSDYDVKDMQTGQIKREFKEPFDMQRLYKECIVSNNSFLSTKLVRKIGLYDETLRGPEDYDMWLRIAEIASVYHIPESLYMYRMVGTNITLTTPKEKFAEHVRIVHQKAMERQNARIK